MEPQCGVKFGGARLGREKSGGDLEYGDTEYGEYPWHVVLLRATVEGDTKFVCGGALIDNKHVLSAAMCVNNMHPQNLLVRVGDWDVNSNREPYPHKDMAVSDIFIHEKFSTGSLHNDLALIRLMRPLSWSDMPHVAPVCLPQPQQNYTGSRCWVTGWGQEAFNTQGELQARLQEVDVPVMGHRACEKALREQGWLGERFQLHPGSVCAGGEAGKDACQGDGGGPLVCQVGDSMELAGLVSWGVGCGQQGVPGVYTNIAAYVNWIRETVSLL